MSRNGNGTAHLILMCGPAFAGKTVLAGAIVARLGCALVSFDEIDRRRGTPHGGEGLPAKAWQRTSHEAANQVSEHLAAGRSVVVDDTFCFRFKRDRFRALATAAGVECTLVCLELPPDEGWRRLRANRAAPTRPDVPDHLFAMYLAGFEWPGDDEPALRYRPQDEPTAWIEQWLT